MQSFTANTPQPVLDDLRQRILRTRWPDALDHAGWNYGTDLSYLKELCNYWAHNFNWRQVEAGINAYPNFITTIAGVDIHFLHIKSKCQPAVPLLITHGWPGSFLEMHKLIPLLTNNDDLAFDLVIPSVVGFGFSGKFTTPGGSSAKVAELWAELMRQLGYEKFGLQGGDIGAGISSWLALRHPEQVMGLHLNYIPGAYRPYLAAGEEPDAEYKAYLQQHNAWGVKESAYSFLQATKPATPAYALNDSPAGLCAWIIEKFNGWSDNNGHIESVFSKDELLANVTLYWITQSIHSSFRIYNENAKQPLHLAQGEFIQPPVGIVRFPKELPTPPRSWIAKGYNVQYWSEMPAGGHFAAMEQPLLLAGDIRAFFKTLL